MSGPANLRRLVLAEALRALAEANGGDTAAAAAQLRGLIDAANPAPQPERILPAEAAPWPTPCKPATRRPCCCCKCYPCRERGNR